jgi:AraC family transcriptional regulator
VHRNWLAADGEHGKTARMLQPPTLRLVHYPPGLRQPTHAHAEASLSLLLAGRLCEGVGNRLVSAQAGQWCHKAAGVDHATDFGPEGATTLQLVLPARAALSAGLPWRWGSDASVTGLLWTLLGGGLAAVEPEILHDLAALLEPCCEDARSPPWWPRAHEALCEGLVPIGVLAADCGVHRAQLVRVTQRHAGCTPVVLRQRARLGRSLARLDREPGLALCDLALACGFADQAHFNRECQRWLGQAPGRWRRRWGAPGAAVPDRTSSGP